MRRAIVIQKKASVRRPIALRVQNSLLGGFWRPECLNQYRSRHRSVKCIVNLLLQVQRNEGFGSVYTNPIQPPDLSLDKFSSQIANII